MSQDEASGGGSSNRDDDGTSELARRVAELEHLVADGDRSHGRVRWTTQEFLGAISLLAVIVYGAVRFADAAFYSRLGTSPSAVGLNYAETLSRVAGAMVLFVAVAVILLVVGNYAFRDGTPVSLGLLASLIAGAFCISILRVLLPPSPGLGNFRVIPTLLALAIYFAGASPDLRPIVRARKALKTSRRVQAMCVAVVAVVVFGLAGLSGYRSAGDLPW